MSAGSHPADEVSRMAIQVMRELGIDISHHKTKSIDDVRDHNFDYVITVCDFARDFCPVFRGKEGNAKQFHWSVTDPYRASNDPAKKLAVYREVRDDIERRVKEWLKEELGIEVGQ
jgi:arsenate reductase